MTIIWLLVWLMEGQPQPTVQPLNVWAVCLALALLSDITGACSRR